MLLRYIRIFKINETKRLFLESLSKGPLAEGFGVDINETESILLSVPKIVVPLCLKKDPVNICKRLND